MTGGIVAAGMLYPARFKHRFNPSVLAHSAVEREKDDIRLFAKSDYSSADEPFALAEVLFQPFEVGLVFRHRKFKFTVGTKERIDIFRSYRLVYVRKGNGMTAPHKRRCDKRAGRKGNVSFGTHSSCKNCYFHRFCDLFLKDYMLPRASFSAAASLTQRQRTSAARERSASEGYDGAMRRFVSSGSMP